jgi:hypothetical protein
VSLTSVAPALGWARRHRAVLAIGAVVVAAVTLLSVLSARSAVHGGALDPQNPSAGGAQAVARVLAAHGVQVSVVRRASELEDEVLDAGTTVMVTSTGDLGRSTTTRLHAAARDAGALVLAAPGSSVVSTLRLPVAVGRTGSGGRVGANCREPLLTGLHLDVPPSTSYQASGASPDRVAVCFPAPGAAPVSWVVEVGGPASPTYVVGAEKLFANERVDRADNAAVALRLLGQHDRLVWYVPDPRDIVVGDRGSLAAQLPAGLGPALWLALAALLATMLWRGRRLGPLGTEPLPVVVKAVESTQGRGRLYHRVQDRSHAARILRGATARRLAARLRLPDTTDLQPLAAAVAAATGLDASRVLDLLADGPVPDDRAMTRLAADLASLEKELRP